MELLILAFIAIIPAYLAEKKGRSFWKRYIYAVCLWIFAIIHVFFLKDQSGKQCVACCEWIDKDASICKVCKTSQTNKA